MGPTLKEADLQSRPSAWGSGSHRACEGRGQDRLRGGQAAANRRQARSGLDTSSLFNQAWHRAHDGRENKAEAPRGFPAGVAGLGFASPWKVCP